jgi:hypothetical protein
MIGLVTAEPARFPDASRDDVVIPKVLVRRPSNFLPALLSKATRENRAKDHE